MRTRDRTRFFHVPPEDLRGASFRFPGEEEEHIVRVLRLSAGAEVTAVDGEGNGAEVRLRIEGNALHADVIRRFRSVVEPAIRLTLAVGLVKGREMDEIVERCAEIGVAEIVPFLSERSVPRGEGVREGGRRERWARLARSGMKVARGAVAPVVRAPSDLEDVWPLISRHERAFLLGREAPPLPGVKDARTVLALVGPEGGFTEEEMRRGLAAGAFAASLGPRNLRTATACAVVSALFLAGMDGGAP